MDITYQSTWPDAAQIEALFETTGWNDEYHLSLEELSAALRHSWYVVSAYAGDRLVGFGRVISDGVLHALICELIVAPEYQSQGIGSAILIDLVTKCRAAGIRDVQLFCARSKVGFYLKHGFVSRPDDAPGMQFQSNRRPNCRAM